MLRTIRVMAGVGLALLLIATSAVTGSAHEHRQVADGTYELTVGFINEPAFVNQQNGLSLRVVKLDSATPAATGTPAAEGDQEGTPVEGLADTLTAEVIYGDQSMQLELEPVFNEPGAYEAIFFPTASGAYSFHITGEIEGIPIDETFTSGPETFSEVEPIEPLQFPKPDSGSRAGQLPVYPA